MTNAENFGDEIHNVYANNIDGESIHISNAESGRRGYFCQGCNFPMQAVKSLKQNRISYFRHDVRDVKIEHKCTYSDETFRHKLAKEILQRIKRVKVPNLYKYHPKDKNGNSFLIAKSKIIEAYSVGIENSFFENEEGEIVFGKNTGLGEKNLIIKPDVTFFDVTGKPILFIEIVATHKIDDEKRIKLKRLGIDTIQIKIPKESPQEIENCFLTTNYTKWIYNYDEECTDYFSISNGDSEGIPIIDKEQRNLLAESFICRKARINNIIRTIKKCLESQPYRTIERNFESEISRVEKNTISFERQWEELQNGVRNQLAKQFEEEESRLEDELGSFEAEYNNFRQKGSDLERRYLNKRKELENVIRGDDKKVEGGEESIESRRERIREEKGRIEELIRIERNRSTELSSAKIGNDFGERERIKLQEEFEDQTIVSIKESIRRLPEQFESNKKQLEQEIRRIEELERNEIQDSSTFEREYESNLARARNDLEKKYERIRAEFFESIKTRHVEGNGEFAIKLKEVIRNGALLKHFKEIYDDVGRKRKAREIINQGIYKNWDIRK
jgi:hypothetical protein